MPTYEDPGGCLKCCCPPCAVYKAQGFEPKACCGACCCGCLYTLFCWDPTEGGPQAVVQQQAPVVVVAAAPVAADMQR
jgi:hypothetical protein